jgi:Domain of unknown function (DUF3303)
MSLDTAANLGKHFESARPTGRAEEGQRMKFMVSWTTRPGSDPQDNVKSSESLIAAFGTWTPPDAWTISEFVTPVDGRGGTLICETDDLASIDRAVAQYLAWLDYEVVPVVDVGDGVASIVAGTAWARSAGGID